MKKSFALVFLIAAFTVPVFAQNVLSATGGVSRTEAPFFEYGLTQSVFGASATNSHSSYEPYTFSFQGGYNLDAKNVSVTAALHFARESVQLTGEGVWYPLRFNTLRIGTGGVVNVFFDSIYAFELNIMPGAYIDYRPLSWFMIQAHINYLYKGRAIYIIAQDVGLISNHTIGFGFRFNFYVPGNFHLYLGGDSTELFRYMILGIPTFTAGVAYTIDRFTFAVEANVRYIDFFTLSANCEGTEVRAFVEVHL